MKTTLDMMELDAMRIQLYVRAIQVRELADKKNDDALREKSARIARLAEKLETMGNELAEFYGVPKI